MSTSKKSTAKASKSPAPATKPVQSAPKRATKKTATAAAAPVATPPAAPEAPAKTAPAPKPVPVKPAPVAKPAVKAIDSNTVVTTITARVDVGFGNFLFVRGEGAGLNWEKGVAMECIGPDQWQIVLGDSSRGYTFKFLLNDETWNTGPDFVVPAGASVTLTPEF